MATTPAFELKGTVSTLTVLRLRCTDLERIGAELGKKVTQLPHFFLQAPVVVDVSALEQDESDALDLAALAALLREHKLVPVAASGLGESRHADAAAAGLGLLKGALPSERKRKPAAAPPAAPAAEAEAVEATSAVE
ncbi:MAG: hypothetical protein KC503_35345, partial [Myxococcales bacterium]|nr:hypothetical protein [Myxococcales bacterium]